MTGIGGVSTVAHHEQLAVGRERFPEFFDDLFDGGQRDAVERCFLFFKILVEIGLHGYRSEEHTTELQSLMRISYDVLCLKKKIRYHSTYLHNSYHIRDTI